MFGDTVGSEVVGEVVKSDVVGDTDPRGNIKCTQGRTVLIELINQVLSLVDYSNLVSVQLLMFTRRMMMRYGRLFAPNHALSIRWRLGTIRTD